MQGRQIGLADLDEIQRLRREHPEWSRFQLSIALAQRWQWRNGAGQLKDMAARAMLLKLHARGLIELPAPRRPAARRRVQALRAPTLVLNSPIQGDLKDLRPIHLELVQSLPERRRVSQLLQRYHYRGHSGAVGENVQYLAKDVQQRELAVMVFGAAAWKVACRDQFIGWSVEQRLAHLGLLANQQRFLILPWVRVPHLASHLLGLAARRLCPDWQSRYGHPICLLETFVELERFSGAAYKAAGWLRVGQTTGRTRQDRHRTIQSSRKALWLRPLCFDFQKLLTA